MGIDHEQLKYSFKGLDSGLTRVKLAQILTAIAS